LEKPLVDATKFQTPSHTLPVENINRVNEIIENGIKAGGVDPVSALSESFMYLRSIEDLDGYLWGIMYLDLDKFKSFKKDDH
jgi:predicted lactoylglutathione lyase